MELFWEQISEYVDLTSFSNLQPGPLFHPIEELNVERRADLGLELTTKSKAGARSDRVEFPPGTIRDNTDTLSFENRFFEFECVGLGSGQRNTRYPENEAIEKTSFHKFIIRNKSEVEVKYTVEFVLSNSSFYIWPEKARFSKEVEKEFKIGDDDKFSFSLKSSSENPGWNSIRLTVDGVDVAIYQSFEKLNSKYSLNLLYFYKGSVSSEIRNKIRDCVAFLLGQPMVLLGFAETDERLILKQQVLFSPFTMYGATRGIPSLPPAPHGERTASGIDSRLDADRFGDAVNRLYALYDTISFKYIYWLYWRARCLPFDMAIVFYAAALEHLEREYSRHYFDDRATRAIPKEKFSPILKKLKEVASAEISNGEIAKLFENKLGNLNSLPKSMLTKRFFDKIGIKLGDKELVAWNGRNSSAHGNKVKEDEVVEFIRSNKLLKGILDRAILAIMGNQDFYRDYCSFDFPIRRLEDPPS